MKGAFCSKNFQRFKYVCADWVGNNLAFLIFDICRYYIMARGHSSAADDLAGFLLQPKLILEQCLIPIALLPIYWLSGYYNSPFHKSRLHELALTLATAVVSALLIYLLLVTNDQLMMRRLNYELLAILGGSFFIFTYLPRVTITSRALKRFMKHDWSFTTLIVGNSDTARLTKDRLLSSDFKFGYSVAGFVAIEGEKQAETDGWPVYSLSEIEEVVNRRRIDQFIISLDHPEEATVLNLVGRLISFGIPVKIMPDVLSFVTSAVRLQDIFGEPFVDLSSPVMGELEQNLKRTFDVVFSALVLAVLSPLLLAVAVAVKAGSPGPVIYSQLRSGRHRRPFRIYKFRSMRVNAEESGPRLSSDHDPRITPVGRVLRKYRIDELPQFWNVLKGDMSIVGPRPEREYYIRQILKEAPYYVLVHQIRPGITSWGMVKFGYASTVGEMVNRTLYDLMYISNMSLSVDFKIIIYTVRTVMRGSGK